MPIMSLGRHMRVQSGIGLFLYACELRKFFTFFKPCQHNKEECVTEEYMGHKASNIYHLALYGKMLQTHFHF